MPLANIIIEVLAESLLLFVAIITTVGFVIFVSRGFGDVHKLALAYCVYSTISQIISTLLPLLSPTWTHAGKLMTNIFSMIEFAFFYLIFTKIIRTIGKHRLLTALCYLSIFLSSILLFTAQDSKMMYALMFGMVVFQSMLLFRKYSVTAL